MNRRDLLKLFGVGSAIVPLIGGVPELQAEAKLLQEPRVDLVDLPTSLLASPELFGDRLGLGRYAITVEIKPECGNPIRFSARAFTARSEVHNIDVYSRHSPCDRELLTLHNPYRFTIDGVCVGPATVTTLG